MFDPSAIQLLHAGKLSGLYESFSYRGTSTDGRLAFWLKHDLLRGSKGCVIACVLVTFDRKTGEAKCIYDREELEPQGLRQFSKSGSWEGCTHNFASGSFFEIGAQRLRGKLHTPRGSAAWEISLDHSNEAFFHLPAERLYRMPWPSRKLLTRDCRIGFRGRISCAGMVLSGEYIGACGHQWGRARAHEYAAASCNWFREDPEACFDGYSLRLVVAGGLLKTPYFTLASLKVGGQRYDFNTLGTALRQHVDALDNYRWLLSLHNAGHRLEVAIDGANPRVEPWIALHEEQPDGTRLVIKNTMFAAGRLRLYEKGVEAPLCELNSDYVELETLLPGNVPDGKGFIGTP